MGPYMVVYWWNDTSFQVVRDGVEFYNTLNDAKICGALLKARGIAALLYKWGCASNDVCGYHLVYSV